MNRHVQTSAFAHELPVSGVCTEYSSYRRAFKIPSETHVHESVWTEKYEQTAEIDRGNISWLMLGWQNGRKTDWERACSIMLRWLMMQIMSTVP